MTSPSTRRAWIEIDRSMPFEKIFTVALHPEGVDRNWYISKLMPLCAIVALHPEGVDRNLKNLDLEDKDAKSRPPPGGRG